VRRIPITATAFRGTAGNLTSRRVNGGTGDAKESTIFWWITSLIYPSLADKIADYCPFEKDKSDAL
jgi:hypothetical protein